MGEVLSSEQVARIRRVALARSHDDVLALCDTVESLRAELETLRGVAKRNADGWVPSRPEDNIEPCWTQFAPGVDLPVDREPMSPAEVHAIYGPGKENENDAAAE